MMNAAEFQLAIVATAVDGLLSEITQCGEDRAKLAALLRQTQRRHGSLQKVSYGWMRELVNATGEAFNVQNRRAPVTQSEVYDIQQGEEVLP